MISEKLTATSLALAAQGVALVLWVVAAELPTRGSGSSAEAPLSDDAAAPLHPDDPEIPAESQSFAIPAESASPTLHHQVIAGGFGWDSGRRSDLPIPLSISRDLLSEASSEPARKERRRGQPASPGTLAVQVPGGVCAAVPAEPEVFSHQVGHQRIAFSWPPTESARFYRIQESREGSRFKDIKGAARIADTSYCLRIRHWDTAWGQARYRLLACSGEDQPCAEAGILVLAAEAANRSVADIMDPGIRTTSHSERRTALALSADGNTMVWAGSELIGKALGRSHSWSFLNPDTVNVSVREGGVWRIQASFRTGHDQNRGNTDPAKAVALSADGGILAFGASDHTLEPSNSWSRYATSGGGAVYVYGRHGGQWSRQAVITPGAKENGEHFFSFGAVLAVSADGRTLAAADPRSVPRSLPGESASTQRPGPPGRFIGEGSVAVFRWTDGEWTMQDLLRHPDSGHWSGDENYFGQSLALSADGDILAVGSPGDDGGFQRQDRAPDAGIDPIDDSGAVFIYTRSGGSWRMGAYIKDKGARYGDRLGTSVSLNAAGNLLAAGAPRLGPGLSFYSNPAPDYPTGEPPWSAGTAYLFARSGVQWTQIAKVSAGMRGVHDSFGASVSLSTAGDVLAVGAPEEASSPGPEACPQAGAVYVYSVTEEGAVLRRRLGDLRPRLWGQFGAFLALSGDGSTLAAAAPGWGGRGGILDGDPLEWARIAEYGRRNFRSLYVY